MKILLQQLWELHINWDDPISEDMGAMEVLAESSLLLPENVQASSIHIHDASVRCCLRILDNTEAHYDPSSGLTFPAVTGQCKESVLDAELLFFEGVQQFTEN